MRTRLTRLFYRASAAGTGAPAPAPSSVTAALLTLSTPNATANVGDPVTATLAPGVTGDATFTRDGSTILSTITGANTATYTATALDADKRVNVLAGNLVFTAGLTPSLDPGAVISFYGAASVGSTLTAAMIAGTTAAITIKRADGTTATTATGASASYTLTGGDMALLPFTATASGLVLTAAFSSAAAPTPGGVPFVTLQAFQASASAITIGDVFAARLADGVLGTINFARNGTVITSQTAPLLNGASYAAVAADAGTPTISAVINNLTFTTGGVYGTPVIPTATSAPVIYGLDIPADRPNRIRIGYLALNNLDTASVPTASMFTLSGTIQTAKTITAVSIDNSDSEVKYVYVDTSSSFQPGDAPTLQYTSSAIRYPGGAAAAGFTLQVYSNILPPATLMYASNSDTRASSPSAGVVTYRVSDGWVAELVFDPTQNPRFGTSQDCTIQMSVLPDWGTSTGIIRAVALNNYPPSQGWFSDQQYNLRRVGNTLTLWEVRAPAYGASVAVSPSYTFPSPGPLCLARAYFDAATGLCRMETTEDGGSTWTQRSAGTATHAGNLYPTAYSNSTSVPVTGVATTGFAPA